MASIAGHGLQSLEIHLLAARSFVLRGLGRLEEARSVVESERALAEWLDQPALLAMASHDCGMVALAEGAYERAAELLGEALLERAPISRPLTRLALAEALAGLGIALLPHPVIAAEIAAGRLVRVLPQFRRDGADFYAVYVSRRHLPRAVSAFIEFAVERLRSVMTAN